MGRQTHSEAEGPAGISWGAGGEITPATRVERHGRVAPQATSDAEGPSPGRRRWYARPMLAIIAVTALGGALRFYHLSTPHGTPAKPTYVFDEVYYAKDGCYDAGYPYKSCHLENPGEQTVTVHPPTGREIIALGERLYGNRPFGWRVASAVFGTLSVLLAAVMAYRLFASTLWAAVAGLLLATESLNFVQSRVSMLDIFLATFVLAGFLFLVLDRQWIERRTPPPEAPGQPDDEGLVDFPPDRPPAPIMRPWRVAAGVALGLAFATKWSGAPALVGALLVAFGWEWSRRRHYGVVSPFLETIRDEAFGIFVFLVLVPLAVYAVSYARWFAGNGFDLGGLWRLQRGMADYSLQLRAKHPYASKPWTWLLMIRPVAYYYVGNDKLKTSAEILGMGNPLIFWGSIPALLYALVAWFAKRDWKAGLIVSAFAIQYAPWFLASRTSFLFYMAPITPFMVMAWVYALRDLSEVRIGFERVRALAPLAGLLVIAAVAMFFFFFPVLTGRLVSTDTWHARMWLGSWI
jgi:dolichyl-phosphate-mannose-protein mannosyltransferase